MQKDKNASVSDDKLTDPENAQADSKSEVREGQGNSSIHFDKSDKIDKEYPKERKDDSQNTTQEEYVQKKSNSSDDDA